MDVNVTFELSMVLDNEKFRKVLRKAGYLEEQEDGYVDQSFAENGITVKYRNSRYKKKVNLYIYAGLIPDSEEYDPDKFLRKLDKGIGRYFEDKYRMDDFVLSGALFTVDLDVCSRQNVSAYLKVLQRVGRVKGFSPTEYECFSEGTSFCVDGNSNSIEFRVYDLGQMTVEYLEETSASRKIMKSIGSVPKGILRAEVHLTKPKAVRGYTGTNDVSSQIAVLLKNCKDIFLDTFVKVIPYGDFYKKDKAAEIIQNEVQDRILRRRMLRLLTLIPEKKSLYLAQKSMNCRNIEKIMKAFEKINVSPVTISKRHNVTYLKNIYGFMIP